MEFSHQAFPADSLLFYTAEELAVTGYCQRIHSQIYTQYGTVVATVWLDVGLCGERKAEEDPSLIVLDEGALSQFPLQIRLKYFRN